MPVNLQLSQTAVPFPYGVLAASTFVNSQKETTETVDLNWERDGALKLAGKDATEAEVLALVGKSLKGQETAFPTLPTPLTSTVPFAAVSQIFDALDNWLALRTFFSGHALGAKDFEVWGAIKTNLPAIGIIKKNAHVHLARWYSFVETLPSTAQAITLLSEAKNDKSTKKADITLDLPGAIDGGVVTRFPPEPSGYLHIGHSKAALLNRYFADKYNGKMLLRFDDTNPLKENSEFEDSIKEDLELLNITFDSISHTSDHFDKLHEIAIKLINDGNAYCDDTLQQQMRDERFNGIASGRRDSSVADNFHRFDEMTLGSEEGQKWCLRAKMSYDDPNKAMRDTVIYRCVTVPHHRTGSKYFSYPTYDFACPVVDSLEGVTHALRTNEYRDRNPQYMWFIDALNIRKPNLWDFSRLNFVYTLLSKRKLAWFVNEKHVAGWDDPRFPTVRGIRRRGLTIEALKEFIILQGASQSQMTMEWDNIWTINKRIIDPVVPRFCALTEKDLVTVEITGGPSTAEVKPIAKHKKNAELGDKQTVYSSSILIEQADAITFEDNEELTLMDWGNAFVRSKTVSPTTGLVTALSLELHLDGDFKKTKKKVTWLSTSTSANPLTPVTLLDFDYLITKKKLEEDDSVEKFITPTTEFTEEALADANIVKDVKKGDTIQFERKGYYICDQADGDRRRFILIPDGRAVSVESKVALKKKEEEKAASKAKTAGGAAAGAKAPSKKSEKKKAAGEKKAAAPAATGELSPTRVVLSDATSGFEIPVSTMMYDIKRVYGDKDVPTANVDAMYSMKSYTEL